MSQPYWVLAREDAHGVRYLQLASPVPDLTAVAAFTRCETAERLLREIGPPWQVVRLERQQFVAVLRAQGVHGIRRVLLDPEQTRGPKTVNIQGSMAVLEELLISLEGMVGGGAARSPETSERSPDGITPGREPG